MNNYFSIPEVKTTNLQEYLSLPKSEREHTILFVKFYKLPYALPFGGDFNCNVLDENGQQYPREQGWKEFKHFVKTQYPIQYFVRETIPTVFYSLRSKLGYWKWKDFYYNNIRTIFHPFNNNSRKIIGRSWKDFQTSIVEVNFAIVNDLVSQEYKDINSLYIDYLANITPTNSNSETQNSFDQDWFNFRSQLFNCWKYINEKRPKLVSDIENSYPTPDQKGTIEQLYGKQNMLEKQLEEQDSLWLSWIISNRQYFWG